MFTEAVNYKVGETLVVNKRNAAAWAPFIGRQLAEAILSSKGPKKETFVISKVNMETKEIYLERVGDERRK